MRTAALVFTVLTIGCASVNQEGYRDYLIASERHHQEAAVYVAAGNNIEALGRANKVPDTEWARFVGYQMVAHDAENGVYAALVEWRTTGIKPENYDDIAQSLRNSQLDVIRLSVELTRQAAEAKP